MDFRVGEKYDAFQFDIADTREVEILYLDLEIVLYRYFVEHLNRWAYKIYSISEVEAQIKKASEEKEYSDACNEYYGKQKKK